MATKPEPIYLNLSADDPDLGTTEIESMCMNCQDNVRNYHPEHSNVNSNNIVNSHGSCLHFISGNHKTPLDEDPVLQGDRFDVVFLRTLRLSKQRNSIGS